MILPSPLLHIFFRCQNFLKHRRVPLRSFSVLWVNIFRQKIVAIPLLSHKLYGIWSFVSETDILDRKSCYPPSFSKNFSKPENLWNKEVFPYEIFRYRETKQFRRKIVIPPPLPLLSIQLYDTGSFLKHKKSSRTMFVGTVRKQFFDGKSWYSTSSPRNSSIPDLFWYTEVSPTKFFGNPRQKFFDRKSLYSPHSYPYNFSKTHILWNTEGFFHEAFRHCEMTKFRRKISVLRLSLPPLIPKIFR